MVVSLLTGMSQATFCCLTSPEASQTFHFLFSFHFKVAENIFQWKSVFLMIHIQRTRETAGPEEARPFQPSPLPAASAVSGWLSLWERGSPWRRRTAAGTGSRSAQVRPPVPQTPPTCSPCSVKKRCVAGMAGLWLGHLTQPGPSSGCGPARCCSAAAEQEGRACPAQCAAWRSPRSGCCVW